MDSTTIIAMTSIITAGVTMAIGTIAPAIGQSRAVCTALDSLARQPEEAAGISRTLFVGLAMIESMAIYCFVIAMIMMLANPFWSHFLAKVAH